MKKKIYIFSLVFFLIDLISKIIMLNVGTKGPIKIIKNFFYLDLVSNKGAAFSILSGMTILFVIIAVGVLFYLHKYVVTVAKDFLGVSLVIGGILGNLFDRVFRGGVVDFFSFNIGRHYFPVFNFADIFICVGVALLIIEYAKGDVDEHKSRLFWGKN